MESIIGLYKTECIRTTVFHAGPYKTLADVEYATAGWVDWYNHRRLHGIPRDDPTGRVRASPLRCPQPTTGELLRELTLDPTKDYQPTGAPKGPTRRQPSK